MNTAEPFQCWIEDTCTLPSSGSGALDGRTVALKDLFAVRGHTSSFGLAGWRSSHQPAEEHAPVVERLLAAGASIAGLAKLDQLAYSLIGNVGEGTAPINPRYPDRFSGGSSSGSASAVAAGLADIGLGTDTAGSVRVPAAACGLFGIRPTHGIIETAGVLPLAPSFDVVGVLASSPALLAKVFEVLHGQDGSVRPFSDVAFAPDLNAALGNEMAKVVEATAKAVAAAVGGALLERLSDQLVNAAIGDLFARIQARQIWGEHGSWVHEHRIAFAEDVGARLDRARALAASPDAEIQADLDQRSAYRRALDENLPERTVLVLPVTPGLPPLRTATPDELLEFRVGSFQLSAPSSLTGRPELVVPVTSHSSGLTFGVGLLAGRGEDRMLLHLAQLLCRGASQLEVS